MPVTPDLGSLAFTGTRYDGMITVGHRWNGSVLLWGRGIIRRWKRMKAS